DRVLWSSAAVPVAPGSIVTVTLRGDGTPTGLSEYGIWSGQQSGDVVSPGDRVLWLLWVSSFTFIERGGHAWREDQLVTVDSFGAWTLDRHGLMALSIHAGRDAPVQPLVDRFMAERARGEHFDDHSGYPDPLNHTNWPGQP